MSNLILLGIIVVGTGYWIYKLVTYDQTKFEEDSKDDDFLKPYD